VNARASVLLAVMAAFFRLQGRPCEAGVRVTPEGIRARAYVTGGEIAGPRMRA
jgi:hypothetical protein